MFRKRLRRGLVRITADRLLDDLDVLDWPEQVKTMQRNWIRAFDGCGGGERPAMTGSKSTSG